MSMALDPAGLLLVGDSVSEFPPELESGRSPAGWWMRAEMSKAEMRARIRSIRTRAAAGSGESMPPPFIAVDAIGLDHGGWRGWLDQPPPRASEIGFEMAEGGEPLEATLRSLELGRALAGSGVNLYLGPSLHLASGGREALFSFGPTPQLVAAAAGAFLEGVQAAGVLVVPGDFPGVAALDLGRSVGSRERVEEAESDFSEVELESRVLPFAAAFSKGAEAVKVGASRVAAWDRERGAHRSPAVLDERLRIELGFSGLRVAELPLSGPEDPRASAEMALEMIEAGIDLLAVPDVREVPGLVEGLDRAVADSEAISQRVREASSRVLALRLAWALPIST